MRIIWYEKCIDTRVKKVSIGATVLGNPMRALLIEWNDICLPYTPLVNQEIERPHRWGGGSYGYMKKG
jgi:hypothetical protein